MTELAGARRQIEAARQYTLRFLADLDADDFFRQPQEGVTHIAWQVGHLAMAEYRLAIDRLRGERPEDRNFFPPEFQTLFGKGSSPQADRSLYPAPVELVAVARGVHEVALAELAGYSEADLAAPPLKPHPLCSSKMDALFWCSRHEMLHGGQIGLVRRLLGKAPLW